MTSLDRSIRDLISATNSMVHLPEVWEEAVKLHHETVMFLSGLEQTLASAAFIFPCSDLGPSASIVKFQVRSIIEEINQMIRDIEDFRAHLVRRNRRRCTRNFIGTKRLAVFVSKRMGELHSTIALPLSIINMHINLRAI